MVLLILESLGSTELLFILVMALVFFGPRKLPQLSRTLGKNLAEFRKASEDFKRTWDREANLEEPEAVGASDDLLPQENSILDNEGPGQPLQPPTIQAIAADRVIPRQSIASDAPYASDRTDLSSDGSDLDPSTEHATPVRKRDWL